MGDDCHFGVGEFVDEAFVFHSDVVESLFAVVVGDFGEGVGIFVEHALDGVGELFGAGFGLNFVDAVEEAFELEFLLLGEKKLLFVVPVLHRIITIEDKYLLKNSYPRLCPKDNSPKLFFHFHNFFFRYFGVPLKKAEFDADEKGLWGSGVGVGV